MRVAVCYQDVHPRRGGAETYVYDLCRGLIGVGHQVDLIASTWDEGSRPAGVRTRPLVLAARSRMGRIWQFARLTERYLREHSDEYDCTVGFINTWGQDVLIPQGGVRAASLAANSRRFRPAILAGAYRTAKRLNPRWWTYQAIEKRQYDRWRGARLVAVSRMVRDHMHKYHCVEPERVRIIPNAIDASRLSVSDVGQSRASFRSALGLSAEDMVGFFLAHNFRLKGLGPLLRALELRRRRFPNARPVHLAVCGGGSAASYRNLVQKAGLQSTVHFMGFLEDVSTGFHGSDFFVLPTYYDPCSLVVFEALACGLPVITTRCNGASDVIEPGVHGELIDSPDHVEQLAAAIDRLGNDAYRRPMRWRCGELGRSQSFERHLEALIELFEEVAHEKRRRAAGALRRAAMGTPHRSRSVAAMRS